jgi:hypothetical protein
MVFGAKHSVLWIGCSGRISVWTFYKDITFTTDLLLQKNVYDVVLSATGPFIAIFSSDRVRKEASFPGRNKGFVGFYVKFEFIM